MLCSTVIPLPTYDYMICNYLSVAKYRYQTIGKAEMIKYLNTPPFHEGDRFVNKTKREGKKYVTDRVALGVAVRSGKPVSRRMFSGRFNFPVKKKK